MSNKGMGSFIISIISSIMIAEGLVIFIIPLFFSVLTLVKESKDKKV